MPAFTRAAWSLALLSLACSASEAGPSGQGGDGSTGGTAGGPMLELAFEGPNPLMLPPSASERPAYPVALRVEPPGSYEVRFALASSAGSAPADAALSQSDVTSDEGGRAVVHLTPSSVPTMFELRASVAGYTGSARLPVVVTASNLATLDVYPSYTGRREVSGWVAAIYDDGRTCASLEGTPPVGDPPPVLVAESSGRFVPVRQVPVGVSLAVTLRAGFFAGGCSNVTGVREGERNRVDVTVTNRPIQLGQSRVHATLGLSPSDSLEALLETVVTGSQAALLDDGSDDVEELLDVMHEALPSASRPGFTAVRRAESWGGDLRAAHGVGAESALRDALGGWMRSAVLALPRASALEGSLVAAGGLEAARFSPELAFGSDPAGAEFDDQVESSWTADAADQIAVGTTVGFNPSALLVRLAVEAARADVPSAGSMGQALAAGGISCEVVAETLTGNGQAPGIAFDTCDGACVLELCSEAMDILAGRASGAYADERAMLLIAATGAATVGTNAELFEVDGTWVGELSVGSELAQVAGGFSAVAQ